MAIKRATKPLGINFTPEERKMLLELAVRDKRREGEEVRWLVTAYANGDLVPVGDLRALLDRLREEPPDLPGGIGLVSDAPSKMRTPRK